MGNKRSGSSVQPATTYLQGLSPNTRADVRRMLDLMARMVDPASDAITLDWASLDYQHTSLIRSCLMARYDNAANINNYLARLKSILREAWKLGLSTTEQYMRACSFEKVKGARPLAGRHVESPEWKQLFQSLAKDDSPIGVRDLAIFSIFRATGIRRHELCLLRICDLDLATFDLTIRGKGNKTQIVSMSRFAQRALVRWLEVRGNADGALFCPVRHGGNLDRTYKPLSKTGLHYAFKARVEAAGLQFTTHDARRSFASDLFDQGADLVAVQRQMRHSDPRTTAKYDRRKQRRIRQIVDLIEDPLEDSES